MTQCIQFLAAVVIAASASGKSVKCTDPNNENPGYQPPAGTQLADCVEWQDCVKSKGTKCMNDYCFDPSSSDSQPPDCLSNSLDLHNKGFTGPIPAEDLKQLTGLSGLDLSGGPPFPKSPGPQNLAGPIPDEIGLLTQLVSLNLGHNIIGGTIPTTIGLLKGLNYLSFYSNKLEGPIPKEIGNITYLQNLILAENNLQGPIPKEIGMLSAKMGNLILNKNKLSGLIPDEIGLLTKLEYLDLSNNLFTGAGSGFCKIDGDRPHFQHGCGSPPYYDDNCCTLSPNPAWTDGGLCPVCLNKVTYFGCTKPPVNCTGPSLAVTK